MSAVQHLSKKKSKIYEFRLKLFKSIVQITFGKCIWKVYYMLKNEKCKFNRSDMIFVYCTGVDMHLILFDKEKNWLITLLQIIAHTPYLKKN